MFAYTKLMQAMAAAGVVSATDPYFNLTTLLLNTGSTNGAQNNTFLDSSSSPLTITRNGNVTQGTFTPFSQTGWGNYFDGSSYLQTQSTSAFNVATGNFTLEAWIYPTSIAANTLIFIGYSTGGTNGIGIGFQTTGLWGIVQAGVAWGLTSSTMPTLNQWNHIVACRGGTGTNQTALFLNGARVATGTYSTNFSATSVYGIGWDGSNTKFSGYVSNLRFNTTDVYGYSNTTITVPTSALGVITGTALLTCQSNRFLDNSSNAFAITANGTPSVQAFSPFLPTAAYSTSVVGGSGYFDGSGDYLNYPVITLGSSNVTVEGFFYFTTLSGTQELFGINYNSDQSSYAALRVQISSGTLQFMGSTSGSSFAFGPTSASSSPTANQWAHIAVVRSGTTFTLYLNGNSVATATSISGSLYAGTYGGRVGNVYYSSGNAYLNGYVSNFRVLVGTALYTTTFTPPTAPLTAITNTSLLLSATNSGIYDSTAKNVLETVGNAQVSTTQAKWGTTAIYLDGTGDYLVGRTNPALSMGTGAFTWEAWVYPTATRSSAAHIYDTLPPGGTGSRANSMIWGINSSNKLFVFTNGSSAIVSSGSISLNTWTHVAFVREGTGTNQTKFYINGTNDGTGTVATNDTLGGEVIGASADDLANNNAMFQGYIDDLRITKGYARYTSNFTAPTAAFPLL